MDKSYRVRTNIINDTVLNVNMQQDFDMLEVLSLRLAQQDAYRLHSSNYGVIVGRVLANDAFGIPNAKISLFIERDDNDSTVIESIYPYSDVNSRDKDGRKYNLLPDSSDDDCYKVVGTFPNKRLMLDDDVMLEVYDKYWKYTTVTNQAGDYMLFGVPNGSQQIHVDIDLSDIGMLSQKPRDFEYKGYNSTMFDNSNQFKESTNLESLVQIFSQNENVFVYPFWGDSDNGIAAITRCDIQIQYKFEPTCVFMGSIVSDNGKNNIGSTCAPSVKNGMNNQLVAGQGTIEMIRKTTDGLVEEYQIQGNQLIDSDGVWCYQIPMNLDFVGTDEYGNIVPTDNPNKGIPTRARVRFRISKTETGDEGFSRHTAKYLVPMNPMFSEDKEVPTITENGSEIEKMYNFGSNTPLNCFRDLYWNNVYSVKNYIPKAQVASRATSSNYTALKGSNLAEDQNQIPFNKLKIDIPFLYMVICIVFEVIAIVVSVINNVISLFHYIAYELCIKFKILGVKVEICPFRILGTLLGDLTCIPLNPGISEGNTAFYPGCWSKRAMKKSGCPEGMDGKCKKSNDRDKLNDIIQRNLALEFQIVKLDLYQDWINGCLYMPLWYWKKRKKKTFLFRLFKKKAKNQYCSCDTLYPKLTTYVTCNVVYDNNDFKISASNIPETEKRWHKSRSKKVNYRRGLIKQVENKDGLNVYYYSAIQLRDTYKNPNSEINDIVIRGEGGGWEAVRLYATDIILLGNLNEDNIYGIPQFFKALPSTTANVPDIATIEESNDSNEKNATNSDATIEDSGTTIVTGMDWGHEGKDVIPTYGSGLFMDLSCTYATTKAKSCFNVERLSELGVSTDMTHKMSYSKSGSIENGTLNADGFVTKLELDGDESRAMFATINHIGFVPQDYQDQHKGYQTQVYDTNTNYMIPKFKYMYPVDFDGRMSIPMAKYQKSFKQPMDDIKDDTYTTFRLGAETDKDKNKNSEQRIRHFYHVSGNKYEMPLYNNSYYFYFGINNGNTAIDKFNKMFHAECFKNEKKPFSISVTTQGQSYCPELYTSNNKQYAYGKIDIVLDDIQAPYSYVLYDSMGDEIKMGYNLNESGLTIGGSAEDYLDNDEYVIVITDGNGKTLSERINLDISKISMNVEVTNLGTKFYSSGETSRDFICNDENGFYGTIKVTSITLDGHLCSLSSDVTSVSELSTIVDSGGTIVVAYAVNVSTKSDDDVISGITAQITIQSKDGSKSVSDCLCERKTQDTLISKANRTHDVLGYNDENIEFFVYEPDMYTLEITQIPSSWISSSAISGVCSAITENMSSIDVNVGNGEQFNAFLNTMPVKFMIGTGITSSNFYSTTPETAATGYGICGWYGVHQESSYRFTKTTSANEKTWNEFVNIYDSINEVETKRDILLFKFNSMFKLSNATYVSSTYGNVFNYTTVGGVSPILYRCLAPVYSDDTKISKYYSYQDYNAVSINGPYPNLVGFNRSGMTYSTSSSNKISFNKTIFKNKNDDESIKYLGNYFAAFTKNGGYTSSTSVGNATIEKLPRNAKVNVGNRIKKLGVEENTKPITSYKSAYEAINSSKPYLRALFVDRALDYDLMIIGPYSGQVEPNDDIIDKLAKGCRFLGNIYGGIEMSYDGDYNVISATISGDAETDINSVSAFSNNKLEYSYSFSGTTDENVKTQYNTATTTKFGEWFNEYDSSIDDSDRYPFKDCQYLKAFYESSFGDTDLRALYWSTFNKERLNQMFIQQGSSTPWVDRDNYALCNHYNFGDASTGDFTTTDYYKFKMYNGDFNRNSISVGSNYPSVRFIDVSILDNQDSYTFSTSPCSYDMTPTKSDDGGIQCVTQSDETVDFTISFTDPLEDIEANLTFKSSDKAIHAITSDIPYLTVSFKSDNFVIKNKFSEFWYDNMFSVRTYHPVPITADVIKEIKKSRGLKDDNGNAYLYKYYDNQNNPKKYQWSTDDEDTTKYYTREFTWDNELKDINGVFAFMVKRVYTAGDDEYLTKKITVYQFSHPYERKDVDVKLGVKLSGWGKTSENEQTVTLKVSGITNSNEMLAVLSGGCDITISGYTDAYSFDDVKFTGNTDEMTITLILNKDWGTFDDTENINWYGESSESPNIYVNIDVPYSDFYVYNIPFKIKKTSDEGFILGVQNFNVPLH